MSVRLQKIATLAAVMIASFSVVAAGTPDIRIIAQTPHFHDLIDKEAYPELITDNARWAEGPVCLPGKRFLFSDIKRNRVMSWSEKQGVSVWLSPADYQNGHTTDSEGRIIAASHGRRALLRLEHNGTWSTLADTWKGKRLNSPNDVTLGPDGAIWFTDPMFGILDEEESNGGEPEQDGEYVYRYDPTSKTLSRADTPGVHSPNGLAFSPDGKTFYVSDSQRAHDIDNPNLAHRIVAYPVKGANLGAGRIFAEVSPGIPDGIKTDERGNVWSSSQEGIQVFSARGARLGTIRIPSKETGNLTFCTEPNNEKWLYVTAANLVLRVPVLIRGADDTRATRP